MQAAAAAARSERAERLAGAPTAAAAAPTLAPPRPSVASEATAWWLGALADWDAFLPAHREEVGRRVRVGIPEPLRGAVWQMLTKSRELARKAGPGEFAQLVAQPSECDGAIVNDITRVFPTHPFFRQLNGVGQRSLYAVLKAYSNKDTSTGYCQGMGFVAGLCLLHMPDEPAFWLLARLLQKYNLGTLFAPNLAGLRLALYQLDRLLEARMPTLFAHLQEEQLETSIFATKWFQTLFIYSLPMRYAQRIFDVFLLEGPLVLFSVALAILELGVEHDGLLDKKFEQMMEYLNGVPSILCPSEGGGGGGGRARIEPEDLLERAGCITPKLDYSELQGYERAFVRTEEPVAGVFSIW
jgi:hypothetical protein